MFKRQKGGTCRNRGRVSQLPHVTVEARRAGGARRAFPFEESHRRTLTTLEMKSCVGTTVTTGQNACRIGNGVTWQSPVAFYPLSSTRPGPFFSISALNVRWASGGNGGRL